MSSCLMSRGIGYEIHTLFFVLLSRRLRHTIGVHACFIVYGSDQCKWILIKSEFVRSNWGEKPVLKYGQGIGDGAACTRGFDDALSLETNRLTLYI